MIAIDFSKQKAVDADSKKMQHINFTGNLTQQTAIFSLLKKQKKQF